MCLLEQLCINLRFSVQFLPGFLMKGGRQKLCLDLLRGVVSTQSCPQPAVRSVRRTAGSKPWSRWWGKELHLFAAPEFPLLDYLPLPVFCCHVWSTKHISHVALWHNWRHHCFHTEARKRTSGSLLQHDNQGLLEHAELAAKVRGNRWQQLGLSIRGCVDDHIVSLQWKVFQP